MAADALAPGARELLHRPLAMRALPTTFDAAAGTVEVVWSTGAPVVRDSWDGQYLEQLAMAPGAVRLERLNAGAPLLNAHASFDLTDVIGVVDSAWIADGKGHAIVRFSDREEVAPIVADVRNGILRNISVGYKVHRWEITPPAASGAMETRTAVEWEPYELSLVPIPADPAAQIRSATINQGDTMTTQTTIENGENATDVQTRAERLRVAGIMDAGQKLRSPDALIRQLIEDGTDLAEARMALIDAQAAEQRKTPGIARVEVSDCRSAVTALQDGLLRRLRGESGGLTVVRLLEDLTGRRGSPDELLQRAMSTSDFPALFALSGQAFLRERYDAAGVGARLIARRRQSADLRDVHLLGLSEFPGLLKLGEGGEIRYGDFTDRGGSYRIEEFARGVRLTRRALLTDELDAFSEALSSYGRAIAALEDQLVIDALEVGATGAKSMEDGKALFHADHKNSTTETALGLPSLSEATEKLRNMREVGNGRALNLAPRWLLVPASHEVQALQLCTAINATESSSVNPFAAGRLALEPIVDANLSGGHAYVLADPAGPAAAVELCTGPAVASVESRADFETTSVATRVLADRGMGVRDHRGIVRIPLS